MLTLAVGAAGCAFSQFWIGEALVGWFLFAIFAVIVYLTAMRRFLFFLMFCGWLTAGAQTPLKRVYDEQRSVTEQIDDALQRAVKEQKFVVCQVGGNWCPWCLRFADFVENDADISQVLNDHFILIHVNYNPRRSASERQAEEAAAMLSRLNHPERFGFPVFVVLSSDGRVLHTQDSSFLEEGQGYSKEKVLRFFRLWTPQAVGFVTP